MNKPLRSREVVRIAFIRTQCGGNQSWRPATCVEVAEAEAGRGQVYEWTGVLGDLLCSGSMVRVEDDLDEELLRKLREVL